MKEPDETHTADKMTWKPGDIQFVKDAPVRPKKSAAQRLADRIKRGGSDQQRG